MTDATTNRFNSRGTAAQRAAYTPNPATPASGPDQGYTWFETDTNNAYSWNGSAWVQTSGVTAGGLQAANNLSDVGSPTTSATNLSLGTSNSPQFAGVNIGHASDTTITRVSAGVIAVEGATIATQTYVDDKVAGLSWKQAVRAATTANGTLASAYANGQVIDGVTLATGDRILLKNQTTGSENGIYVVAASGTPSRATDADSGAELVNASVYVSEGTTNADTQWTCTTNATITVGSTSLAFAQLTSGGGALQASNNLSDVANAATAGANIRPVEHIQIACSDETTAITTGTAKVTFRMPYAFTVTEVRASVNTAPTGSTIIIDINEAGTTIMAVTKLSIDASEKTSTTAASAAVISDASLADDAEMTIDFDQVGSTIAGKGVKVIIIGHRT